MISPTQWVIGNWKMNGSIEANARLLAEIQSLGVRSSVHTRIGVCPSFVHLAHVHTLLSGSSIALGAQDVSDAESGAYTGQVSAVMLRELGCELVIVGHSERRHGLGESDALVASKAQAALKHGLTPVVCVGELLSEREAGKADEVVERQLTTVIRTLGEDTARIIVAYEPVWAIGTGRTATPEDAQRIHAILRAALRKVNALHVPILYGGSVKADNAAALMAMPDINGALVGTAALDAASFAAICAAAR